MATENRYIPLDEEQPSPVQPQPVNNATNISGPQPNVTDLAQMTKSTRWVYFLCVIQLVLGVFALLSGGWLVAIITFVFVAMGICGTRRRSTRPMVAHFVYSLCLYIFTLIGLVALIVYSHASFFAFLFVFVFLILQAVGMRHARIMLAYSRLYGPIPCQYRCRARCNAQTPQRSLLAQPEIVVPQQQQAQQVPQVPDFPQQYVPVPQQYMVMPPYQYARYPMMYPGMQAQPMQYVPAYPQMQPMQQQEGQQQQQTPAMYPTVPVVYRV